MHFGAFQPKLREECVHESSGNLRAGEIPLKTRTSKAHLDRSARCDGLREARLVMYRILKKFSSMSTDVVFNCTNLEALNHRDK